MNSSLNILADIAPRSHAGRPTKEQARARENELLDAALDMFLENGFQHTTMDNLAAAVNMSKRTVYAKFEDKKALFLAVVMRAINASVVSKVELEKLDSGDLGETLVAFAKNRVRHVTSQNGMKLQRIINVESYRFPEIFQWSYEHGSRPVTAFLTELFNRHSKAGTVFIAEPEKAATIFMSMAVSGPVRTIVSGNPISQQDIDDTVLHAVEIFLNGVKLR